ncbi:acyl-CoA dehydrogenase [Cupriavidus gilardii J11]|uniref:Acyl-CoA dehydrogenase n=1 Tax=Cupriavidus gilardii J11 TaxID=936133 RepID=A0A562BK05_9BURK|nr:acyl-CoA dehydrogenase family protein [Cupriavidus gilardii]TWG85588.1 acyl-CoA dehydrogenase [Cupriavidus gilardii J11]
MSELEQMLADSAQRLFGNEVTVARIEAAERGEWSGSLWETVEASGLPRLFAAEDAGGAEASWQEALPALLAASRSLAPLPFVETALCGWLLTQLSMPMPEGVLTLAEAGDGASARVDGGQWRFDGAVSAPWGRHAGYIVVRADVAGGSGGKAWLLLSTAGAAIDVNSNLAGEPRDTLRFDAATAVGAAVPDAGHMLADDDAPRALGALARSIQMAGALERVLEQTVQYASERIQFGRPIGKFQAIQQQLAVLANEVVAARMAVAGACAAMAEPRWLWQAMVAKVICGHAAGRVAAIAHQVHGAIGFTYEHSLHFATRRLWSWRAEYGNEAHWSRAIGARAIRRGGAALWPDITGTAAD